MVQKSFFCLLYLKLIDDSILPMLFIRQISTNQHTALLFIE